MTSKNKKPVNLDKETVERFNYLYQDLQAFYFLKSFTKLLFNIFIKR